MKDAIVLINEIASVIGRVHIEVDSNGWKLRAWHKIGDGGQIEVIVSGDDPAEVAIAAMVEYDEKLQKLRRDAGMADTFESRHR